MLVKSNMFGEPNVPFPRGMGRLPQVCEAARRPDQHQGLLSKTKTGSA